MKELTLHREDNGQYSTSEAQQDDVSGVYVQKEHLTDLQKKNDELRAKVVKYESVLNSVIDLIDSSTGVAGLHQNGEVAEWDSILAGGNFEEWLIDLSEAININHANRIKEG